ncbi:bifunctional 2',3'-cyclic-nucleotide 2'-phosphodiesterase/3'-nucleotidase [Sulfitobacter sp. KE34]|uniref:Bifunctional 2',3'-cyclic-nucleotide 2'-phosphodiesterase/3'-nucleotidase n=1 Tax=Sulfitobacter faviae TaxID=1775881 RepID=A0AAX3LSK6_9RHOB|nr:MULTISPECIES: bifunctional 2',3'-cyclic-nucleotide 2'-phosphodiesterase/3'-nucleotidase [Sulfitobacter]MDF3350584.1 bifunctional 2',3'-cyclic-nucleotide 2'-phosphodiesterase/3'-nucleotidase [Sulfitobacter sp. KE12]MDF3354213.1 bifunctional 2',3'-cyclic-nucleotide 2'-phosphodiesterase/3'-nucleotidase [Sulfitobacter sp. KE27]MDF3357904.1 bifunctional 2',3'-cyclic-nucleotide 2'-phosphodiesterase/3'-nucleotidase [Sulfitobacter sp. KE33]MDF3359942.1 bifunctional 2',3'-cyclic-nucleotide 2'-phospho
MTLRLNRRHFLAGTAGLLALHPFSLRAAANQAHLRLMETTDLHVHVFPYDYYADKEVDTVGLARTASIVKSIRAEATNTLMLDNGDFLQGNPMGDYIAYERGMKEGDMHPVIQAMNALGYDASTLGNHEFNYGLDFLMKSLAGADFPVVSANVVKKVGAKPSDDETLVKPYVLLDRMLTDGAGETHPIKVGIIGFVPPQIMSWDRRHLEGKVQARDILESARAWVPQMKEAGADIIIALSHSGIGAAKEEDMMENASVPLAAVEGIDAIMTGHSHLVFPSGSYADYPGVDVSEGTIHGKPATMGGFWGSHLGLIDLMLERDGSGWRIASHSAEARAISQRNEDRSVMPLVESDAEVLASVQQEHDETLAYVRRAVGKTDANLHSYFALVADDPSVQVVSNAQRWYIEQMLEGTEHEGLPILSAAAPFKAGGRGGPEYYTDVPKGDVAIKNVSDLYLYPNTARAVRVTGAQVKDWLERSAGMFNQITPGKANQPLLNPEFPSYNFDVIDGVTYQIDLSQPSKFGPKGTVANPEASRIVNLEFEGQPLDPEAEFIIATNNYRASGGGAFPGAMGDTIVFEGPDTNRDVIVRYIVEKGTISPRADGNWRFAPLEETSVMFETGPKAADYVDEVTGVEMEQVGDTVDGFAQFRIIL